MMKPLSLTISLVLLLTTSGLAVQVEASLAAESPQAQSQELPQKVDELAKRVADKATSVETQLSHIDTTLGSTATDLKNVATTLTGMATDLKNVATTLTGMATDLKKAETQLSHIDTTLGSTATDLKNIVTNVQTIWNATFWILVVVVVAVVAWLLFEQLYRKRFQKATDEVARLVQIVTGSPVPPMILAVQPNRGRTAGGTPITITGRNFQAVPATITLRGQQATGVLVISAEEIRAVTPPGAAGPADVTIHNRVGAPTIRDEGFTYQPPPVVRAVIPEHAAAATNVNIWGGHFQDGARVVFGTRPDVGSTFQSENQLLVAVPEGLVVGEPVRVLVRNQDGQEHELANAFRRDQ